MRELDSHGWSQAELARKLNMTKAAVHILLKRKTAPLSTITKIGKALEVDPKDLLI